MMSPIRIIRLPVLAMILLFLAGTAGYISIEHWPILDAAFMTVITLSTVGFGVVHEMSRAGEVFTTFLIIVGVLVIAWAVRNIFEATISDEVRAQLRRRRMEGRVRRLTDHYIICGYGRIGRQIAREFRRRSIPYVIIESDPDVASTVEQEGSPCVIGNATDEEVLGTAGIEKARGLVTVVSTDSDNLFITLSAKQMNPDLFVVTRCADEASHPKLYRAGADRVVSPYLIAGRRMASALLHPTTIEFMETVMHSEDIDLEVDEFTVPPESPLCGTTIGTSNIHKDAGAFVIAVKTAFGQFVPTPSGITPIEAGCTLVAVGTPDQLERLRRMVGA
jgi:voltage-gated potassium channel